MAPSGGDATVTDREQRILGIIETTRAKRPKFKAENVTMAHGAGGKATQTLIEGLLVPAFDPDGSGLAELADAGRARWLRSGTPGREAEEMPGICLTTDSFVVKPIRFPGGSIGELAVNGTVNDLAVAGARPVAITVALILEEGISAEALRAEVEAIASAAAAAGVEIVAGDTKVVERGQADQMYITTTGIGAIDPRAALSPTALRPGDQVIVSGPIGEHGTAIMLARDEFELDADIESDTQPLWDAADALLDAAGEDLRCMRDATRGGVATVLNELARASGVAVVAREGDVPVRPDVDRRRRDPRNRPDVRRKRGPAGGLRRARVGRGGARGAARRSPAARARPRSARSRPSRRGWSSSRPPSAASASWTCSPATRCPGSADQNEPCDDHEIPDPITTAKATGLAPPGEES